MISTSVILRAIEYVEDEIGVSKEVVTETEIPIIKIEKVGLTEFYRANEVGFKPTLKIRISALNYNEEPELVYLDTIYTINRVDENATDEVILVCSRKLKNV